MALLPNTVLAHCGINVTDIEKVERFYVELFGFQHSDRGVRFNGQKVVFLTKSPADHHQLVLIEGRPKEATYSTINQLSFALASLDDLRRCYERLVEYGLRDIVQVNHGNAWSLYIKDPEDNPLELFVDSPWHTPQPCRGDLDLRLSSSEILSQTEALCRSRPDFATREDRCETMRRRLNSAQSGTSAYV